MEEYSWRLILFLIHPCYTSNFFGYTEREFSKKGNTFDLSFELIRLHKNIKTRENCFKKFWWRKVIVNTKTDI